MSTKTNDLEVAGWAGIGPPVVGQRVLLGDTTAGLCAWPDDPNAPRPANATVVSVKDSLLVRPDPKPALVEVVDQNIWLVWWRTYADDPEIEAGFTDEREADRYAAHLRETENRAGLSTVVGVIAVPLNPTWTK
jgi:hypothetical protein